MRPFYYETISKSSGVDYTTYPFNPLPLQGKGRILIRGYRPFWQPALKVFKRGLLQILMSDESFINQNQTES